MECRVETSRLNQRFIFCCPFARHYVFVHWFHMLHLVHSFFFFPSRNMVVDQIAAIFALSEIILADAVDISFFY